MRSTGLLARCLWVPLALLVVACSSSSSGNHGGGSDAGFPLGDGASGTDSAVTSDAGTDASETGHAGDASAIDGSPEAAPDGGACIAPSGWPAVTPTISTATGAPGQSGGMLTSGAYYLTAMTIYNATSACQETLSIMLTVDAAAGGESGAMTELSQATVGKATEGGCVVGTFQTNGDAMVRTTHGISVTDPFSANANTITLIEGADGDAGSAPCEPTSMTFTLQP